MHMWTRRWLHLPIAMLVALGFTGGAAEAEAAEANAAAAPAEAAEAEEAEVASAPPKARWLPIRARSD